MALAVCVREQDGPWPHLDLSALSMGCMSPALMAGANHASPSVTTSACEQLFLVSGGSDSSYVHTRAHIHIDTYRDTHTHTRTQRETPHTLPHRSVRCTSMQRWCSVPCISLISVCAGPA